MNSNGSRSLLLRQRSHSGGLTKENLWAFLIALDKRKKDMVKYQSMKLPKGVYQKYFSSVSSKQAEEIMVKALEQYYSSNAPSE